MKPVFLSMQAFGPFASLQAINFQDLGENPLFLINGPTGAGKSTILDAISFALYGESTGRERDPTSMRCDLSDSDTPTEVTFDFVLSKHVYRIIRTPAQELTKKKGVGTTPKGPTASVYRHKYADLNNFVFDETHDTVELLPLKGVKEVNDWVKDLTGLSSEQFRQVMVLPQGQFRKLLLADSDQREQIFSQLFQTNIYKQIEEQLKLQSAELRNNRKSLNENITGLLDSVELTETDELVLQLAEVEPKYLQAKKSHESAQKKALDAVKALQAANDIAKKHSELETLQKSIASLNSKATEVELLRTKLARADQANKITPFKKTLKSATASLEIEIRQQADLEHKLKELSEKHKLETEKFSLLEPQWLELDAKKQELNDWQRKKQLLSALIVEQTNQKKLTDSLTKAEESIRQRMQEKEQINKGLIELSELIKTNNEALSATPKIQADFERFDRLGRLRRHVADTQAMNGELNKQAQQLRGNLQELVMQRESSQTNLQKTELSWHQGQAFELAQQLNNGEPCMVCGSTEHPQPANLSNVTFASKEQVNQARVAVQNIQAKYNSIESELKSVEFKMSENEKKIKDLQIDIGEYHEQPIEWFREQWK
ncbi:AAA family ATPase, partial [Reinekea sp.]